jgi:hypothetical protein
MCKLLLTLLLREKVINAATSSYGDTCLLASLSSLSAASAVAAASCAAILPGTGLLYGTLTATQSALSVAAAAVASNACTEADHNMHNTCTTIACFSESFTHYIKTVRQAEVRRECLQHDDHIHIQTLNTVQCTRKNESSTTALHSVTELQSHKAHLCHMEKLS